MELSPFSYFFFFGCFDLLLMARTDIKEMWIDDRYNYFMMGIVGSLFALAGREITVVFLLIGIALFIRYATAKTFAEGDRNILQWSIVGIGILGFSYLMIFFFFLCFYVTLQYCLKRAMWIEGKVAGVPALFGAFFTTGVIYEFSWNVIP